MESAVASGNDGTREGKQEEERGREKEEGKREKERRRKKEHERDVTGNREIGKGRRVATGLLCFNVKKKGIMNRAKFQIKKREGEKLGVERFVAESPLPSHLFERKRT
uniref:Uncharacterized protein n=1 Tax=Nelumbo nucifera TaxID=4432 RepID=A0A822ZIL8_NELNU|nr:TPA_asm: hypothetical protein HUJ06_002630 [Nelumbo nucifera]